VQFLVFDVVDSLLRATAFAQELILRMTNQDGVRAMQRWGRVVALVFVWVLALGAGPAAGGASGAVPEEDITGGSDGSCGGSAICTALPGYDGPTGLGTPNGTGAF
jgi:hypothetical protein